MTEDTRMIIDLWLIAGDEQELAGAKVEKYLH
jgi:hypothetical protein